MAPTVFHIYISSMVADWRNRSSGAGVSVLYKHGRKLVGDLTSKSRLSEMRVTESSLPMMWHCMQPLGIVLSQ